MPLRKELEIILDNVPAMVFYKDTENRILRVNATFAELVGRSKEELEGVSCFDLFSKEEASKYWEDDKKVIESGDPMINEIEVLHTKSGEEKWVRTIKIPDIRDNIIIGIIGFAVDITNLVETQSKLESMNVSILNLLNYATFYVLILDEKFNIRMINYSLATALGFDDEHGPIGMNWTEFIPGSHRDILKFVYKDVLVGNKDNMEFTNDIITKNGETITVKWFNSLINSGKTGTFSVGLPLTKYITNESNIDSVRSYWRDVLDKDKSTIQALKSMVFKDNE